MRINVLKKGDHVLSVTQNSVAVQRKNGEVDIIPIVQDGDLLRIDTQGIITIGYGNNTIAVETDDITITTF